LETSLEAGAGSTDKDIKALAEAGLATLKQERERVKKLGLLGTAGHVLRGAGDLAAMKEEMILVVRRETIEKLGHVGTG